MRVSKEFNRHFRALEAAMGIEGELQSSADENFENLYKMSDDKVFGITLSSYADGRLQMLRTKVEAAESKGIAASDADYSAEVIDFLFHSLCSAMGWRYLKTSPKIHHWLPVSYTRHFASESLSSCHFINSLKFVGEGLIVEKLVTDKFFAHAKTSEGDGFYHLAVEKFFFNMEVKMGDARTRMAATKPYPLHFSSVAVAAFFVVQTIRNPHPDTKTFSVRTIKDVVNSLIKVLEDLPAIYCRFAEPENERLAFTPYVPTHTSVLANETRALYFPISPAMGFVMTDQPIFATTAKEIVSDSNHAIIEQARISGEEIYGISYDDLPMLVENEVETLPIAA